jgi:hypothetical protein
VRFPVSLSCMLFDAVDSTAVFLKLWSTNLRTTGGPSDGP